MSSLQVAIARAKIAAKSPATERPKRIDPIKDLRVQNQSLVYRVTELETVNDRLQAERKTHLETIAHLSSEINRLCSLKLVDPSLIQPARTHISDIMLIVANHAGISVDQLLSMRKTPGLVQPRHVAMFLAYKLTGLTVPQIGRAFANRDHSTITHAVSKIRTQRVADALLDQFISECETKLVIRRDASSPPQASPGTVAEPALPTKATVPLLSQVIA